VLTEQVDDTRQCGCIGERLIAAITVEDSDRDTPGALPRDAPIRTRGDHVGDTLFAPRGHPLHFADCLERPLTQAVPIHADEPLFGRPKDGGFMAAPAMRVTVLDLFLRHQLASQ
jgi:hypothetical protein